MMGAFILVGVVAVSCGSNGTRKPAASTCAEFANQCAKVESEKCTQLLMNVAEALKIEQAAACFRVQPIVKG